MERDIITRMVALTLAPKTKVYLDKKATSFFMVPDQVAFQRPRLEQQRDKSGNQRPPDLSVHAPLGKLPEDRGRRSRRRRRC
jgi:hypothetical protein